MGNYGFYGFSRGGGHGFYGISGMAEEGSMRYDQIPGLLGWYDAVQESAYADGDAMYTLRDWGPNGINLSARNTTTYRALYKIAITNGLPGVLFDGTDDSYLTTPSTLVPDANDFTIAAVVRPVVSGAGNRYLISGFTTGSTGRLYAQYPSTGITSLAGGTVNSGDITPETYVDNTPFLHALWAYSGTLYAQIGAGTVRSGTFSNAALGYLGVGYYAASNDQFFKGYLHELLFFSPHIEENDLVSVQGSLMAKWGLS